MKNSTPKKWMLLLYLMAILNVKLSAQTVEVLPPPGDNRFFGESIVVSTNGNYLVSDPMYSEEGKINTGAVYLYNGKTHQLISKLTGVSDFDWLGEHGTVMALPNGNFIITSQSLGGSVTWIDGQKGLNGAISDQNSLVDRGFFYIGSNILVLKSGDFIICSSQWNNKQGAVTFVDGAKGITGYVNEQNSLVGTKEGDEVGIRVIELVNGKYVVASPNWDNGTFKDAGAVTLCDGAKGCTGYVNEQNSLVGKSYDQVGINIQPLANGNYVVYSPSWSLLGAGSSGSERGAITWCDGNQGRIGYIDSTNSLIGSHSLDKLGEYQSVIELSNGNYIVPCGSCDNDQLDGTGAITWCDGTKPCTGTVGPHNSLMGEKTNDMLSSNRKIYEVSNSNYIIFSEKGNDNAGLVKWCDGYAPTIGVINKNSAFSGASSTELIHSVNVLQNGNYVVISKIWDKDSINFIPALTWVEGNTGIVGKATAENSLLGTYPFGANEKLVPLQSGHFVFGSSLRIQGNILPSYKVTYTWIDGTKTTTGFITPDNSLFEPVSSRSSDFQIYPLPNGHYIVSDPYWSIDEERGNLGAVTWCDGFKPTIAVMDVTNSIVGSERRDMIGYPSVKVLSNSNYLILSKDWAKGNIRNTGALTWAPGTRNTGFPLGADNSFTGESKYDMVEAFLYNESVDNKIIFSSPYWNNGSIQNAGAVTLVDATTGIQGVINSCNSVIGLKESSGILMPSVYNPKYKYLITGIAKENKVVIFYPTGMQLSINNDIKAHGITGNTAVSFIQDDCRLITTAAFEPGSSNLFEDSVTARVWVAATQPAAYVKRYIDLQSNNNSSTTNSRITLYATQQEFDAYNTVNSIKLPVNKDDVSGISNLLIENNDGNTNDASGRPETYNGNINTINPADSNIVWNELFSRWEISFDTDGLGGFWIKTEGILPMKWISIAAQLNTNNQSVITWKTESYNTAGYEIEKSADGRVFAKIGSTESKGNGINSYTFTDPSLINGKAWYRIRETEKDNSFSYSEQVLVERNGAALIIYPNPAKGKLYIQCGAALQNTSVRLLSNTGKTLQAIRLQAGINTINLSAYANGIYFLHFADGRVEKIVKE